MNRQKLLTNLVRTLHHKGRALVDDSCVYVVRNHPGCGIGCQPGFREKFAVRLRRYKLNAGPTIRVLLEHEQLGKDMREFFGVTGDLQDNEDVRFLCLLQHLHDSSNTWSNGELCREEVKEFADKWKLKMPAFPRKPQEKQHA